MDMRSSWKRAAKARLIGAGLAVSLMLAAGVAAPSMAQEGFSADFGVMRGVRRRCLESLLGRAARCRTHERVHAEQDGPAFQSLPRQAPRRDGRLEFKVCKDQTYALCAAARCNVYDGVAYCQCEEKHGDSISLPFPMGKDEDVCSINAAGADNKYMVSTYSLPEQIVSPQGDRAIYTCEGGKSGGAYAQCDGGALLQKHRGDDVPRLRQARAEGTDRLFLPDHPGQSWQTRRAIQSSGLPLRQVLLQVLQRRHRQ